MSEKTKQDDMRNYAMSVIEVLQDDYGWTIEQCNELAEKILIKQAHRPKWCLKCDKMSELCKFPNNHQQSWMFVFNMKKEGNGKA